MCQFSFLTRVIVDMCCHRGSKKKKKTAAVEAVDETDERDIR